MTTRNLFDRPDLLNNQMRLVISADTKPRRLIRSAARSARQHEHRERPDSIASGSPTQEIDDDLFDETVDIENVESDLSEKIAMGTKEINYDTDIEDEQPGQRDYSSKGVYLDRCRRLAVVPSSYFLRHIDKEALIIRFCGLKPTNIRVMVPSLKVNSIITKLDLRDNNLGSRGAAYIANLLTENDYIDELNLGNNDIGTQGCKALCRAFLLNTTIRTLYLDGNRFNDNCAQSFADVFSQNERITYVNLNKNLFENETTGRLFGQALKENQALVEIHLGWNCLNSKACGHILKSLAINVRLTTLDLSWNGAGLSAAKAVHDLLKTNTTLEDLRLDNNRFNTECATHIGKGLSKNEMLKVITLNGNPLESSGCYAVIRPLIKHPTSQLQSVDLRGIIINSDFIDLLNELAGILPQLNVKAGSEGVKEVA